MRYTVPDHVLTREVGGETVLLDIHGEEYFVLDEVGAVIFASLSAGSSVESAVDAVLESYEVDAVTARADADRLVEELTQQGLLAESA